MTKEEFIEIRDTNTKDVMPILCFYHNLNLKFNQTELTLDEFREAYTKWLQIPLVAMHQGMIINETINKLNKYYDL